MVNLPPAATVAQPAAVYQVTVPEEPEVAVNTAPVVTPLLLLSSKATVMKLPAAAHVEAVNVRCGVVMANCEAAPATTDSACLLLPTAADTVTVGFLNWLAA